MIIFWLVYKEEMTLGNLHQNHTSIRQNSCDCFSKSRLQTTKNVFNRFPNLNPIKLNDDLKNHHVHPKCDYVTEENQIRHWKEWTKVSERNGNKTVDHVIALDPAFSFRFIGNINTFGFYHFFVDFVCFLTWLDRPRNDIGDISRDNGGTDL